MTRTLTRQRGDRAMQSLRSAQSFAGLSSAGFAVLHSDVIIMFKAVKGVSTTKKKIKIKSILTVIMIMAEKPWQLTLPAMRALSAARRKVSVKYSRRSGAAPRPITSTRISSMSSGASTSGAVRGMTDKNTIVSLCIFLF